uniref:Dedicator of cytokinesis TPR repeats region domain-containing protein n=1 Tax=Sphenodon punctatus TaxID=8508 RepID=A0A8D0LA23_SPHPU
MSSSLEGTTLLAQGAALKYLPSILEDMTGIFDVSVLGCLLRDFIGNLPPGRLLRHKLQSLTDIVNSPVFQAHESREMLLQTAVPILQELIGKGEEEEASLDLLSNILEVLYKTQKKAEEPRVSAGRREKQHKEETSSELGKVKAHVKMILQWLLRTVNRRVIALGREHALRSHYVACMTAILSQLDAAHYSRFFQTFPARTDLLVRASAPWGWGRAQEPQRPL